MADCTDAERKLLDNIKDADVMIVFRDEDQSSIVFMRGYDEHPPAKWSVDYGWLGEDGKSGEKIIRKFAPTCWNPRGPCSSAPACPTSSRTWSARRS